VREKVRNLDEERTGSGEDECETAVNTCTYAVHTQCPQKM